jgi:hydroxylamine dehydrogenase
MRVLIFAVAMFLVGNGVAASERSDSNACINCHEDLNSVAVKDWRLSKHARAEDAVGCADCHVGNHRSSKDVANLQTVTPQVCAGCHEQRFEQYSKGKHAVAWAAMNAMPTTHYKAAELIEGQKGCGGCHKIGLKSEEEIEELKAQGSTFGHAACDSCHTRHTFSVLEAREPEACATCHMGFDHPQWEMYSTSKHGVRHRLKKDRVLPRHAAAPTCQDCHMADGDHEVRTAWGFLAVRTDGLAPYPGEDEQWWADRVTILQALGVLDPEGNPTPRLDVVAQADVARLTAEDFDREREKMINVCIDCHSANFAEEELAKGDRIIQKVDHLLAEAIRIIVALYEDGVLERPEEYASAFPDLLAFSDSPTPIENRLFNMHLKHRMRAFQGAFHANPDYALWYGWSEMQQDLTEIKSMAEELRRNHEE